MPTVTKDHIKHFSSKVISCLAYWKNKFFSKNSFMGRAIICWILASILLKFDAAENYDFRFQIRGNQHKPSDIVLIHINPNEFAQISNILSKENKMTSLFGINELSNITDAFFWDTKIWTDLISILISQKPKNIGITFFFNNNNQSKVLTKKQWDILQDKRVIWASSSLIADKNSLPFASQYDKSNIGSIDLLKDEDSVVRRIISDPNLVTNFAAKLSQSKNDQKNISVINYRNIGSFQKFSLNEVLTGRVPKDFLKDKIIIIGAERSSTQQILTPMGQITRQEFWAQVTDNYLTNKFIKKLPFTFYLMALLLFTLFAVFIITSYPQEISLAFFLWMATLWTAFSIWIFDSFSVWIPIASTYALLVLIWIMHMGYQALKIEKAHYQLQKEQEYFSELEQLKNNFVSLISHDLKTPIAKIQAVVDRLNLQKNLTTDLQKDFSNLKEYSEELNKYIQSILKLLRVESKEFKILKEAGDLNGVIENVTFRLQPLANAKNISIHLELEPMFLIEFDVTLMTEVLLNIIENAIKYTNENGNVRIHTSESDSEILIEVHDTGEGIANEDLDLIWKKFTRGKNQDLKTKGTGLGLYLAKYFIELHGGKISVKSVLGKGTSFYIRLPIEQ